jgi:hypothetical protein
LSECLSSSEVPGKTRQLFWSNRSVLLMTLNDTVFSSMAVAANSHVNFRWSQLIFFYPCGGQLMVVPSNFRTSPLSQFRRVGGTRGKAPNSRILRERCWIVSMFLIGYFSDSGLLLCVSLEDMTWVGFDCELGRLSFKMGWFSLLLVVQSWGGFGGRVNVVTLALGFGRRIHNKGNNKITEHR